MNSIKPLPLLVSGGLLAGPAICKKLDMIRNTTDIKAHLVEHGGLPGTDKNLHHKDAN
jgi:hypothetical protein